MSGKRLSTNKNDSKFKRFCSKINIGTLNLVLIIVGILFVAFNYQMIQLYREWGSMPETYASAIVVALLGECGICGKIFTTKLKHKSQQGNLPPPTPQYDPSTDPTNPVNTTSDSSSDTETSSDIPSTTTTEVVDSNNAAG